MLLLVGVGLGQVFETFPFVITGIKVLGVTYLLYLAWIVAKSDDINTDNSHKVRLGFLKGALFQWVNAKAWVVAIGAISAFTIAEGSIVDQVLVISSIFLVLAFPCVGLWLVFGARLRGILHSSSHRKTFNISMAALLVVSVLPVIYDLVSRL